eukprot:jgi/Bigna1/133448/aug1.21_g8156
MERLCALFKEAKADKSLGVAYFEAEAGRIIGPSTEDVAKYLISNFDHLESSYVDSIKEKDLDDGEDDGRGGDNDEEDSDEERSRGGRDTSDERRDTSRAFETEHREWNQNDGSNNTGNSVRELHSRGSEEKEKRNRGNDVGANMILCCNLPDDCIETDVHEVRDEELWQCNVGVLMVKKKMLIFTRADVQGVSVYFCGSNYAVVELADKKNRDQALAKCSGAKVRSRLVELSAMETRKRIFIGNIPKRMSQSEIEKGAGKRIPPLPSSSSSSSSSPPSNVLYVKGFGPETNSEDLRSFFGKFAKVEEARVAVSKGGKRRDFGFVNFASVESAKKAYEGGKV